jgi:hypothetical protein
VVKERAESRSCTHLRVHLTGYTDERLEAGREEAVILLEEGVWR